MLAASLNVSYGIVLAILYQTSINKSCSKSRESHWASIKKRCLTNPPRSVVPYGPHIHRYGILKVFAFVSQGKVQVEAVEVRRGFH